MNNFKRIVFPLFSLFLAYRSVELVKLLNTLTTGQLGIIESLIYGFLFTLFITGVFAFIGFAYPSHKILPKSYYQIKNPEALKAMNQILGVKYFQIALLFTFWGKEKNRKKYFNGTKAGIQNFSYQTKQSEFGHFAALIVILLNSVVFLWQGHYLLVAIITVINLIGNFYPVLLQRMHRIRIQKISNS